MPVDLSIVESTTELGQTVVEVVLDSSSAPGVAGPAGQGVPTGGTIAQVLTKQSATDFDSDWEDVAAAIDAAPVDATYLVTAAHADLDAEVVVGATPGGELGGTWAVPTVDATHSGSSHASIQAAAEATAAAALSSHEGDTTSVHGLADTSVLATDSEVATAVSDHSADTTAVHGVADTSALALTANHPSNATFNDHSARHEDAGPDEISIAGLSGVPADVPPSTRTITAGDGLSGGGNLSADRTITVNVDGSTLELNADTLRVKAAGILATHMGDAELAALAGLASAANKMIRFTGAGTAELLDFTDWASYSPVLTAVTTNPTLGTGGTTAGRWMRIGKLAIYMANVTFGTSGTNAGSGEYRVSLPFTCGASGLTAGSGAGACFDSSASDQFVVLAQPTPSQAYVTLALAQTITAGNVTHNGPIPWGANDQINIFGIAEIA